MFWGHKTSRSMPQSQMGTQQMRVRAWVQRIQTSLVLFQTRIGE